MKSWTISVVYLLVLATTITTTSVLARSALDKKWADFKTEHGKSYENKYVDKMKQRVFESNLKRIQDHNQAYDQGLKTFRVKLNKFADMTPNEFSKRYMQSFQHRHQPPQSRKPSKRTSDDPIPDSIDWRDLNSVTDVKEQGFCAASHVYAEVAIMEAITPQLNEGTLIALSEQNVIECANKYPKYKPQFNVCTNGSVGDALDYVAASEGIDTAQSYPNVNRIDTCHFDIHSMGAWELKCWLNWQAKNETDLQEVIADSPAAVYIDASSWEFMFYSDGVYTDDKCVDDQPSLAVAVVGYDSLNGTKHWILKNSWGTNWGMNGYMLFARQREDATNQCGIASDISWIC